MLVAEVYYHTLRANEYVVLENVGGTPCDLAGWALTDGEGMLTFPPGSTIEPGRGIVVAQNSTAFFEDTLERADFRYLAGDATSMVVSGTFQLNNSGDEVLLLSPPGVVVDAFAYGASPYRADGWVGPPAVAVGRGLLSRRAFEGRWLDTDGASDWDLVRVRSPGQSEFAPKTFEFEGRATAFVSPDDSLAPLRELVGNAVASIDASLYTFRSRPLAASILDALARGVAVRILLEGGPVGGMPSDGWDLATSLAGAGADVRLMVDDTERDIQERYRFAHAKYAILDGTTVVVSSENWGPSGFPERGTTGSRGWSLAVDHAPLARYFQAVFEEDFDGRRRDISPIADAAVSLSPPKPQPYRSYEPRFPSRTMEGRFRVVPVLGPDTALSSETLLGALRAATRTIDVQLFYADPTWGPFPNMYLEGLLDAARRGVAVRILLDGSYYNVEDDRVDNDDTVAVLEAAAMEEGLNLSAKLVDGEAHGFVMAHNKGLIIDGTTVLVSSVNWNRNSPTANREAGLLVTNPALASYFAEVFEWDWKDDVTPPSADAGPDREVAVGTEVTFSGLGASDDGGVVAFSWDLDGDGTYDATGPEVTFVYLRPGTYVVRLLVSDAWNNTAGDTATVVVRSSPAEPAIPWAGLLGVAAAGVAFHVAFARMRRKRKGINKPP